MQSVRREIEASALTRAPHRPHFATFLQGLGRCQGACGSRVKVGWLITITPPLEALSRVLGRIPRPTPKAWGGGVPKETGFLQEILMGVGKDRRSRSILRANRKMPLQEETWITHSKWTRTPPSRRFPKINWVHQLPRAWSPGCAVASLKLSAHLCPLQG